MIMRNNFIYVHHVQEVIWLTNLTLNVFLDVRVIRLYCMTIHAKIVQ